MSDLARPALYDALHDFDTVLKTAPGEKYQAPDGSWKTRTAAAPLRDSRCTG